MPIGKWLIIKGYDKKKERAPRDPDKEPRPPPPPPKEVLILPAFYSALLRYEDPVSSSVMREEQGSIPCAHSAPHRFVMETRFRGGSRCRD